MPKWETYNHAKGQKARWLKLDEYWNKPTEIFARYTEQYVAYVNYPALFDKYTREPRFWSKEEFMKLLDDYYDILDNQLAEYRMDEWNALYHDAMVMLNQMRNNKLELLQKTEQLNRIEKQFPDQTSKILNMIYDLEKQYLEALNMVESLKWTIREDMFQQYATELSTLQSNFDLLIEKEEQYIAIQRENIEQQIQQELA